MLNPIAPLNSPLSPGGQQITDSQWRLFFQNLSSLSSFPWIDADSNGGINLTVTAIGSTTATLVISTPQILTANLTIPSNVFVIILGTGSITTTGYTLTISGFFAAGLYQVFFGSGLVTGLSMAHPEWWGLTTIPSGAVTQNTSYEQIGYTILSGTVAPSAIARFYASEAIIDHAHYGFLDDSIINYQGGAPIYGHASFDDNVTFQGTINSDHHNSFQSYPHYNNSGTIGTMAGFFMQPDITAGTVNQLAGLHMSNPTGTGTIPSLYGVLIESLTRGSVNNYAIWTNGPTPSFFGGPVQLGSASNTGAPAIVSYNTSTGDLDLQPRGGYNVRIRNNMLTIGPSDGYTASIENAGDGNFKFTPRSGYYIELKNVPVYANEAAAVAGGLPVDAIYKTATGQLMIVY